MTLHQTYDLVLKCEEDVFNKHGISTEQHAVLIAIKYIGSPVTISMVSRWLDRNPNTISLIVDRMVRAGLVKRIRDMPDRRAVRLVITDKGQTIFDQATVSGWKLIQDLLFDTEPGELSKLVELLETVRGKCYQYLYPGEVMEQIKIDESTDMARFLKRVAGNGSGIPPKDPSPDS